jgi:hypothetical protein
VQNDFKVAFDDAQALHILGERLHRTVSIIESCLDITDGIRNHWKDICVAPQSNSAFRVKIECINGRWRSHKRTALRLLEGIEGVTTLVRIRKTP